MIAETHTSALASPEQRPWFKEPMIWMVIAIPLSAVIVGMIMLTLAIRSYDGLVVDDYYKYGKEINRVLTRNENAFSHQLSAKVQVTTGNNLILHLTHANDFVPPQQLEIKFIHRTLSGLDQSTLLQRAVSGLYQGILPNATQGLWHVHLETVDWRITGSVDLPKTESFSLTSQ